MLLNFNNADVQIVRIYKLGNTLATGYPRHDLTIL